MKTEDLIVIGSGGHAKVIIDILQHMSNYKIIGITSVDLKQGDIFQGYKVLGDDGILPLYINKGLKYVAMGIGGYRDNKLRKYVFNKIKSLGLVFINVLHPKSIISNTAKLAEGVTILPGAIINTDVTIGDNVIIATGASVEHETIIENHVLVSAGVTIGAYSIIKEGALIALGSKVISGITIGSNALVAAGAVVTNDIKENQRVFGIPAKEKIMKEDENEC